MNITGKQKKAAARLYAVQALFQMEASGTALDDIRSEFLSHRFGAQTAEGEWIDGHIDLFERLIETAVSHQAIIDQATDKALVEKWPIDRIDPTLRALFRAAGAELQTDETPPKVVISQFVDIARDFFPEGREAKFVNAVLDHMARGFRPEAFG